MTSETQQACPLCGSTSSQSVSPGETDIDVAHEARRLYTECLAVMARARERELIDAAAVTKGMTKKEIKAATNLAMAMVKSDKTVLNAIRTAKPSLELLANILGKLQPAMVLNLHASAEYVQLRGIIMAAVAPHRAAMMDLAQALDEHLRQRTAMAQQTAQSALGTVSDLPAVIEANADDVLVLPDDAHQATTADANKANGI